ncbi:hypothetical protein D3C78_1492370 [compost metagenome]
MAVAQLGQHRRQRKSHKQHQVQGKIDIFKAGKTRQQNIQHHREQQDHRRCCPQLINGRCHNRFVARHHANNVKCVRKQ